MVQEAEIEANVHGTCRLPYSLLKDEKEIEKGYLLSSKDVCALDLIPRLINAGVKSFKIEGRMKSKEYVGLVTSIYRKYINLAESGKEYVVDNIDKEILMQVFNRGGFSSGYLNGKLGKEMMYIEKPNHIGVTVGEVISYNPNKGHIKVKLNKELSLGDSIAINDSSCKISELMIDNKNIKLGEIGQVVTIGRIKGKIFKGNRVNRTVLEKLNSDINQKIVKENIKRPVNAKIELKEDEKIKLKLTDLWTKTSIICEEETKVEKATNNGITNKRITEQLSKTGNTPFEMNEIEVLMDENIILPISSLNSIRRNGLEKLEKNIIHSFKREEKVKYKNIENKQEVIKNKEVKVSVLFNSLKESINYENLKNIDSVYIPFKEFLIHKEITKNICDKFNTYVVLPNITKSNYEKLLNEKLNDIVENCKGIVISNISHFDLLRGFNKEIIANYTLNITNNETINEFKKLGVSKIIISPEADKEEIQNLGNTLPKETIVYGRALLMTTEYCLIGTYKNCMAPCEKGIYTLKDRMGFKFPIYTDRTNCNNLIFNSKITSIIWDDLNVESIRIDILEETEEEIQSIINVHKNGERLEGENYTNGNLNRAI